METKERLNRVWKIAPTGSRALVYTYGYTHQNISSILKVGRKDETIVSNLLDSIKRASAEIAQDVNERNNQVQSL